MPSQSEPSRRPEIDVCESLFNLFGQLPSADKLIEVAAWVTSQTKRDETAFRRHVDYYRSLIVAFRNGGDLERSQQFLRPNLLPCACKECSRLLQRCWNEKKLREIERDKAKARRGRSGHIYLARSGEHFKIGKSARPVRRVTEISLSLPSPIELVHQIPTNDMYMAERNLHERFSAQRKNGEWFLLSESQVREIMALKEMVL